ncbi:MAG: HDOD domain-containing protein [Desulfovibrionaceae bacterium]|nr:HDOD domain-containing protein [Desulfovibrionaceae bacterium]
MSDVNDRLLAAVEKMPAFPQSVSKVLALAGEIDCSQKDLVEVIKRDPVFTLKILRLVNSAYFGLSREITSINHASVYLGLNTLKNAALSLAAVGVIPETASRRLDMGGFWLHSLAVAACTNMLGLRLGVGRDGAADYFAAGLLHDIGKVVFALYMPGEFEEAAGMALEPGASLVRCEREVLGATHADIGAMLADKWNLPTHLRDAIAFHHDLGGASSKLLDCLYMANQITKRLAFGSAGNFEIESVPERIRDLFGMDVDGLANDLPTLDEEVENARIFIKLGEAR